MSDPSSDVPWSGGIPYAVGQASVVRIPIPGTNGLCVELRPRGFIPTLSGRTSSTLFFQDKAAKRMLRLDYGFNKQTQTVDYHWNQRGVHSVFDIASHTGAGRVGQGAYYVAKYFRHAGRVFVITGVAVDVGSIVLASNKVRRASQVVAGWAAAWAGCKVVGAGGAAVGSLASPLGTAAGAFTGCIIGGAAGYYVGSDVAGEVYDWAEETVFTPLPRVSGP